MPKDLSDELNSRVTIQLCTQAACGSEPDEDDFCDGICYSCYLSLHELDEQIPNSQDSEAAYDAALHSTTTCGACGMEVAGDLDVGICSYANMKVVDGVLCVLSKLDTKPRIRSNTPPLMS